MSADQQSASNGVAAVNGGKATGQNGTEKHSLTEPLFSNTTRAIVWGMQTKVNNLQRSIILEILFPSRLFKACLISIMSAVDRNPQLSQ